MLFYVLFVCKCVLPPGDNPIAVNKYNISYLERGILRTELFSMSSWQCGARVLRDDGLVTHDVDTDVMTLRDC